MRWVEDIYYNIALRGSLLPMHLEHRQAARSASEQESVASRCATAAAAFVATRSFNGWRCCPTPPLYKAQLGRAFSLRSPLRAGDTLSSPSFPNQGALALFALRQSGFVANGTRRLTFFATPSTADNGTAVRAFAAPTPTCAPTACVLPSARSVLRTSIADNRTSIGFIGLTFLVHRLMARN